MTPSAVTLSIARLALATYGVRLGERTQAAIEVSASGQGGLGSVMNALYLRDLAALSPTQLAERIVDNIGIAGGVRTLAIHHLMAALQAAPAAERGTVIIEAVELLSSLVNDSTWGIWANQLNRDVATIVETASAVDSYVRQAAAQAHQAPWIRQPDADSGGGGTGGSGGGTGGGGTGGSGGGTGGGGTGGSGGGTGSGGGNSVTTLDLKELSDSIASAVGDNSLYAEGLELLLSRSPTTRYAIDRNNDGILADSEYTAVLPVFGVTHVLTGGANDRVTMTQNQLRPDAVIDLGAQQDNRVTLREGADVVTLVHKDIDRNGVIDAFDIGMRPTLATTVSASGEVRVLASGGALEVQLRQYTLRDVERLELSQAAISDRFDDSLALAADVGGATINLGPAIGVGASLGGGTAADTVARLDLNELDGGGISAITSPLGREWIVIEGLRWVERFAGSAGSDRVVVAADAAMQSVGTGAYAPGPGLVRSAFDESTAAQSGFSTNHQLWEDQRLVRFELGSGIDSLDYAAETLPLSVSIDTTGERADSIFVGAPGAGNGRVDRAVQVERYFGGNGLNRIDLAAASVPTTLRFSAQPQGGEIPEPNGQAVGAQGLTRTIELVGSGDGRLWAQFVERTDSGAMPATAWTRVQGSGLAETVILGDAESVVPHVLRLAGGANRVDYSGLSAPLTAAIGAVDVGAAALTQTTLVAGDTVVQFMGAQPATDRLQLIATSRAGDMLELAALTLGAVVRADPQPPTTSQVDRDFHVVDLAAGLVTESRHGQFVPAASPGLILVRAFGTRVAGFEDASNIADADAVHLLGSEAVNTLVGGTAADLLYGGRGIAAPGGVDIGAGSRGDRLTGGAGGDWFLYRGEQESPGGSIAGGQQSSAAFFGSEFNVINARDTLTDFSPGIDKLVFVIGDSYDSIRPANRMPTQLSEMLNAAVPLASAFAVGSAQLDVGRNAVAVGTVEDFDNYRIDTLGVAPGLSDIVLRVKASNGSQLIDASAGLAATPLNALANEGLRVDVVYTAVVQSQGLGADQILHFRSGSDRIDLSFLQIPRAESARAGNGVRFDLNANNTVDALESGLVQALGGGPVRGLDGTVDNLFIDAGTWRPVAAQVQATNGGFNTLVFVDADGNGHYEPALDMALVLVGIQQVVSSDFVVDFYGGGWTG